MGSAAKDIAEKKKERTRIERHEWSISKVVEHNIKT
jgi:hypothetical protein